MAKLGPVLDHLRRMLHRDTPSTDYELLQRFTSNKDEAAFSALMERYGPVVMGVARRVLHDAHEAEDVFQATFVILVRKAASLDGRSPLATWLHTVAFNLALKAKKRSNMRREREKEAASMTEQQSSTAAWNEMRSLLDAELERLPVKYRAPLTLCYLMGKTTDETAQELGCSSDAIRGRLAMAKDLLRTRLAKQGVVVSSALLGTVLAENVAHAAVPVACASSTLHAALAVAGHGTGVLSASVALLVQEGVRQMFVAKVKMVAVVLVAIIVLGAGAGLVAQKVMAGKGQDFADASDKEPAKKKADREKPKADEKGKPVNQRVFDFTGTVVENDHKFFARIRHSPIPGITGNESAFHAVDEGELLKDIQVGDAVEGKCEFQDIRIIVVKLRKQPQAVNGLKLTLSADKTETVMKADGSDAEPVTLTATFSNVSDKQIKLCNYDYAMFSNFKYEVTGPDGKLLKPEPYLAPGTVFEEPKDSDFPLIKPGTNRQRPVSFPYYDSIIDGRGFYSFKTPGEYRIKISYSYSGVPIPPNQQSTENMERANKTAAGSWTGTLLSNELVLTVKPAPKVEVQDTWGVIKAINKEKNVLTITVGKYGTEKGIIIPGSTETDVVVTADTEIQIRGNPEEKGYRTANGGLADPEIRVGLGVRHVKQKLIVYTDKSIVGKAVPEPQKDDKAK